MAVGWLGVGGCASGPEMSHLEITLYLPLNPVPRKTDSKILYLDGLELLSGPA